MRHFCTYLDSNFLARGLALYRSLERHAGAFTLHVLCFDEESHCGLSALNRPNLRPIAQEEFERGDEPLAAAKVNRSRVEYYFTCTASLVRHVLNRNPGAEGVTYLDADLFFFSSPEPLEEEMAGKSVLIVGHRFPEPLRHLEKWGTYNVGFVAFRNDPAGRACLEWWREACLAWCYDRAEEGRFADQKYLDDWPARFPGVAVARHQGAGLAPWNLARYRVELRGGRTTVDGEPLIFYHFHRFRMVNDYLVSLGLAGYGAPVTRAVWRGIYEPYWRAVRQAAEELPSRFRRGAALRDGRNWRELLRRPDNLLVAGPLRVPFNPAALANPVQWLRTCAHAVASRLRKEEGK